MILIARIVDLLISSYDTLVNNSFINNSNKYSHTYKSCTFLVSTYVKKWIY